MSSGMLDRLLDDDLAHDPVMLGHRSNHLPMALVALHAMGADDDRLSEYARSYSSKLDELRPSQHALMLDDPLPLGTGERYADLLDRLDREIASRGDQDTLDQHLPVLLDGLGGSTFHGVIRLAYALDHGRSSDIVAGLAYLADSHEPIDVDGVSPVMTPTADPQDLLTTAAQHREISGFGAAATGFQHAFSQVVSDAVFRRLAAAFVADQHSLAAIAQVSHLLYRATGNFFALHCVTATHATRLMVQTLRAPSDRLRAVSALGRAVAATYVALGAPALDSEARETRPSGTVTPDWSRITAAAVGQDDEHVIKLVYSARCEEQQWGDQRYLHTAAGAVGL